MSEWSKEPHSKCGIRASVSRVRIPHFQQNKEKSVCPNLFEQADFSLFCKDAVGRLRDYVAILHFKDAVGRLRDYVAIPHFKDAVGRLRDYVAILHFKDAVG